MASKLLNGRAGLDSYRACGDDSEIRSVTERLRSAEVEAAIQAGHAQPVVLAEAVVNGAVQVP